MFIGVLTTTPSSGDDASPAPVAVPLLGTPAAAGLIGLDPAALEEKLGLPDIVRRDSPAEYWRYSGERCALDLFLYRAADGSGPRVAHARLRPRRDGASAGTCSLPARPPAVRAPESVTAAPACCA